ncbi:MAG: ABC transporter ATP-binding protein [Proteiniphilum sp.]|jgi:ABC-type multidrug transport system ATPase subunit|nr:ABC transporter ATP-binding protein [Proteiniphilum sp.]
MIEVKDIHKRYAKGKVHALKGVSFSVEDGEIFGVIGPDGAGKSSLFRILTSLLLPDSGTAIMNGYDVVKDYRKIRQIIGYMPGRFSLYQDLSVEENLTFFATLFNTTIEENYHLIRDIYQQIEPFKKRRAGALSGGMKQKLALSCALIHKPEILILDEPTTGVDPVSRKEFWDMLGRLKEQGIIILVSTAYMDEASRCDRIALIREGEFIANNTPQGIIDDYSGVLWSVEGSRMSALLSALRGFSAIRTSFAFGDKHHITVEETLRPDELRQYLAGKGFSDVHIALVTPTVEDCFMAI